MRVDVQRRLEKLESLKPASVHIPTDPVELARRVGFEPDDWQARVLRSEAKKIILLAGRQTGKSTVTALLATHTILTKPGATVLCVSPSLVQSQEIYRKAAGFWRDLGRPIPAVSETSMSVTLASGARLISLPGSESRPRGYSADLVIADEASRVEEEVFFAILPTLAVTGGRFIMLSTPRGRRGFYFSAWEQGGPEWERYMVRSSECPRITPEFLEEERKALPDFVFRSEYLCEFVDTEDQLFPTDLIHAAVSSEVAPLFPGGLDYDDDD